MSKELTATEKKRLSEEDRKEIAVYYYTHNVTQAEIAGRYEVSQSAVNYIVNTPKYMKAAREYIDNECSKSDLRRKMAVLKAQDAAPDAVDQLIKLAQKDIEAVPMQYLYVVQNAISALLDRAGVRPEKEESSNVIEINFNNLPFTPGMPVIEEEYDDDSLDDGEDNEAEVT